MRLITLIAAAGGAGCSTVAAHLALIFQEMGHSCLAVELHSRNQLGAHLGVSQPQKMGWASLAAQGSWWGKAAVEAANGLRLLPYGALGFAEQSQLEQKLLNEPLWLQQQLQSLDLPETALVIADAGYFASALAQQAMMAAEHIVCCTTPASDSAQTLEQLHHCMTHEMDMPVHDHFHILVCRMDARRPSHQRGMALLKSRWKDILLHEVVHEDEAIPQSWSQGSPVQLHASHALASHDLQGVAHSLHRWLTLPSVAIP